MDDRDEDRWLTNRQATWLKRVITVFTTTMIVFGGYLLYSWYLN